MKMMRPHRSLIVISGVLLVVVATTLYALPTVARQVAISRLQAITMRPVSIDRVDVQLLIVHDPRAPRRRAGRRHTLCRLRAA